MAQTFSVDQLKLNAFMLTGSSEGLFFDTQQVAFGTDAVPTTRSVIAGSGILGGGALGGPGDPDITLDVQADGQWGAGTLEVSSDILRVKDLGITNAKIADGTIENVKLVNSSFYVSPDGGLTGSSPVSLGGSLKIGVNVDGSSLEILSDEVKVKPLGITNSHIANSTIANAKLANDSVTVTAGDGLGDGGSVALGGSVNLKVNVDDSTIETNSDILRVKDLGITSAKLAGSIGNTKLSNSSLSVLGGDGLKGGGVVSLGGSVTLNVEPNDFAGDGLEDDGSDNLKVNNTVIRVFGGQTIYQPAGSDPALAIEGTLSVKDLSITGTLTKISTVDLVVTDNIITLNTGDPGLINGTGISLGVAGIEIWRGTGDWGSEAGQQTAGYDGDGVDRAQLFYNDNPGKDYWEAGLENDMSKILLDKSAHTGWLAESIEVDAVAANLVITGQTLWSRDVVISGDLADQIGDNVGQTATNTTNIATNATNITNLDTNKADKTTRVIAGSGLIHGYANTNDTLASNITIDIKGGAGLTVEDDLIKISNGSVTNAMLVNDGVSYGGVSVDLGGSDATPAFDLTDATDYKSSNLVGTVGNSQLANDGIVVNAGSGLLVGAGAQSYDVSLGGNATLNVRTDDSTLEVNNDVLRVKGNLQNSHLANSSLTVTAGDGLQNGGPVSLGGVTTLDVDSTVVRTDGFQVIDGKKTFIETGYFQEDLNIGGNLTVSGTTTVVHSNEVDVGDRIIKLQADLGSQTTNALPAGFEVNRGSQPLVQLLWNGSTHWTASNSAGTAYEILTKEKIIRNTVALGTVSQAKVDFRVSPTSHTFQTTPSVSVTLEGVDGSADIVSAQLSLVYATGFLVSFSTELTGNYKLHYVATDV
jgi:hypothetical protein